jgi:hypothetical protein
MRGRLARMLAEWRSARVGVFVVLMCVVLLPVGSSGYLGGSSRTAYGIAVADTGA